MKHVNNITSTGIKYITLTLILISIQATILLFASGILQNFRLWLFISVNFIYTLSALFLLYRKNPGLLNERGENKDGIKTWDKYLLLSHNILMIFIFPLIAGFDIRYNWSYLNIWFIIPGFILYGLSNILVLNSMIVNRHFETNVRIQTDRNHKVVEKWPYNLVRHPGYLGTILWAIAVPQIVGSIVGFIPSFIAVSIIFIRTYLEDYTLQNELPNYKEYAMKTRYRLIPLIF